MSIKKIKVIKSVFLECSKEIVDFYKNLLSIAIIIAITTLISNDVNYKNIIEFILLGLFVTTSLSLLFFSGYSLYKPMEKSFLDKIKKNEHQDNTKSNKLLILSIGLITFIYALIVVTTMLAISDIYNFRILQIITPDFFDKTK